MESKSGEKPVQISGYGVVVENSNYTIPTVSLEALFYCPRCFRHMIKETIAEKPHEHLCRWCAKALFGEDKKDGE